MSTVYERINSLCDIFYGANNIFRLASHWRILSHLKAYEDNTRVQNVRLVVYWLVGLEKDS